MQLAGQLSDDFTVDRIDVAFRQRLFSRLIDDVDGDGLLAFRNVAAAVDVEDFHILQQPAGRLLDGLNDLLTADALIADEGQVIGNGRITVDRREPDLAGLFLIDGRQADLTDDTVIKVVFLLA